MTGVHNTPKRSGVRTIQCRCHDQQQQQGGVGRPKARHAAHIHVQALVV